MGEVTEAIRTLLAQGLTSGEIIGNGYRPGTVYKVQRSMRLATALAQDRLPGSPIEEVGSEGPLLLAVEEPRLRADIASFAEGVEAELSHLHQEFGQLRQDVCARLDAIDQQVGALKHQVTGLEPRMHDAETQTDALQETATWLKLLAADVVTLLAQQTIKPAQGLPWAADMTGALNRIRRRLVEINPGGARSLFGDQESDRWR